jgi:cardiolipin synthase (CMP-forming)
MALATSGRPARATWALIALTVGTLAQVSGNIANLLTLSRLLCAFPLYVLVGAERYELAFWIFLAAALSDAADGYIAKTFQGRTMTGAVLDPVSDKVLVIALMLALMRYRSGSSWLS